MTQPKCTVVAIFHPKPEQLKNVRELLLAISKEVLLEDGCEAYQLHEGVKGELVFIETWTTRDLWEIHNSADTVKSIRAGISGKLECDVEVFELYEASL